MQVFNKTWRKLGLGLIIMFIAAIPLWSVAEPVTGLNDLEKTYSDYYVKYDSPNPDNYIMGPEEKVYLALQGKAWGGLPRQQRFAGITDAYYEQLIYSISQNTEQSTANPDAWMVAVHYPQDTGNKKVDAELKAWAKKLFMQVLPVDPDKITDLNPFLWLEEQKITAGKNYSEDGALMLQSFAFKLIQQRTGHEYKYWRKGDAYITYPYITVYQITRPAKDYMSVIFTTYTFEGGAHDYWSSNIMSYDLTSGQAVTLKELLQDSAKATPLIQKRLGELATARGLKYDDDTFGNPAKMELNMSNMVLAPEGLVFIYNPYDIASFADGTIILTIPKADLAALGVNTKYWK